MNMKKLLRHTVPYSLGKLANLKGINLTDDWKDIIQRNGILHYTLETNASMILQDKKIKSSNCFESYSNELEPCSFFFPNTLKYDGDNADLNLSSRINTCISIKHLTDEQINRFKIRTFDYALMYPGDFTIEDDNIVVCDKIEYKKHKLFQAKDILFTIQFLLSLSILFIIPIIIRFWFARIVVE